MQFKTVPRWLDKCLKANFTFIGQNTQRIKITGYSIHLSHLDSNHLFLGGWFCLGSDFITMTTGLDLNNEPTSVADQCCQHNFCHNSFQHF